MKTILQFVEKYGMLVLIVLATLTFFRTCSTSSTVNKLEKNVNSIDSTVRSGSTITDRDVDSIIKYRLYDFLIFEEDLDKGKTSLTDIKIKISANEK